MASPLRSAPTPKAAGRAQARPRRALVLGARSAAEPIARDLEALGFRAELQALSGEPLPSLVDPDFLDRLRATLAGFAAGSDAASALPDLVHPGVGDWAERAELAQIGRDLGLDVVCPPARVLTLFGNKLNLLAEAERLGIPNLVLSEDPLYSVREIERLIFGTGGGASGAASGTPAAGGRHSFPFVLKAVKGGGSFGLMVVQEPEDLEKKVPLWLEQLRRKSGEVILFAERYLEGARHVVLPFARFQDGRFEVFPSIDASLQSRHRKIIELCPATGPWGGIDPGTEAKLLEWAERLADECGYVGVGSVEFLVDSSRAFLIEGSARLTTGYRLWEQVAGTSAVAWQIAAMNGRSRAAELPSREPRRYWAAGIAIRLYAEDSLLHLPQPGIAREVIEKREWRLAGPGAQVTAEAQLGLSVGADERIAPTDYGMIGTLWAGAGDRKQAMNFARGILDELWIAGSLQTNERFLAELLSHPWVKEGIFHAGFVDEEFLPAVRPPLEQLRLFASALAAVPELAEPSQPGASLRWAVGDQWVRTEPQAVKWRQGPELWREGGLLGISGALELEDGRVLRLCAYPTAADKWQMRLGSWVLTVRRVHTRPGDKAARRSRVLALIEGRIHSILYREGSVVPAHEPILIVESLGMLIPHALPVDIRVLGWRKRAEDAVLPGEELADFEIVARN